DKISLNEFHVTLAGSDIEITDAVLQGASLDDLLHKQELEEMKSGKHDPNNLEYSKKEQSQSKNNRTSSTRNSSKQNTIRSKSSTSEKDHSSSTPKNGSRNAKGSVTVVLKKDQVD
ncbi:MAG: hypothetical protein VW868_03925, partial [Bacteroidota bacterium]